MDQASYLKGREREEIMKRLVTSQETYIKELEGKVGEIQDQANQAALAAENPDWEGEKDMLQNLVKKNQELAEDLEAKLREREQEFNKELNERESTSTVDRQKLESENRVLKEIQDTKLTSEKDRIEFHKTLRNMLLEEIERIEME